MMTKSEIEQYADEAKMLSHSAPVFFLPDNTGRPASIVANGTASLVETGEVRLLVTCAHVWTEFLAYRETHSDAQLGTIFQNGPGLPEFIDPSSLIAVGDGLIDIATIRAFPEKWRMGCKEFLKIHEWPMPRAQKGDIVSFLGFAGEHRSVQPGSCRFNYAFFGNSVSDASTYQFILADRGRTLNQAGVEVERINMGGMSGAPVFKRTPPHGFSLVGFLSAETSFGIKVTHASFLVRDGTLGQAMSLNP